MVDLKTIFSRLTLDVATEVVFGESIHSLRLDAPQSTRNINESFDIVTMGVRDRFNMGSIMFLHCDPRFWSSIKILHQYADAIIEHALHEKKSSKDEVKEARSPGARMIFLNGLVKETSDTKRLRDLLLNALAGGRDTIVVYCTLDHEYNFLLALTNT
jgi:hypothetical protein